jgi:phage tail tape-measure protein
MNIAKEIGKKALIGAAISIIFQGSRILGRRVWNSVTGKQNQTANEDLKEFFESSIKCATNVGVQVAVSGALVVAIKSGWIKALQNTPAGQLANITYIGLENAKCLFKLAKGEMTADEALNAMGNTTCCAIGGIYGAIEGAALGAEIGALTTLNPVGIAIGSFIGAVVGGIAGSAIAEPLYKGSKAIVKTAAKVIESAWQGTKAVAKGVFNTVTFGLFA